MPETSIILIEGRPYTGCKDVYIQDVVTDTDEAYEIGEEVYKVPELVGVSYNVSATDTSFYANNVKKLTDTSYNPTASMTLSGDDAKLEKKLFGKKQDGAALKDNLGGSPEVSIIYGLTQAKGGWVVRQIPKATCSKSDSTVDTKSESLTFQTSVVNINPLNCEYMDCYTREFYSTEEVFEGHTMEEVLEILAKNPTEKFETWPATTAMDDDEV